MSDLRVVPMAPEHGASVLAIFAEGIDTGHATFEHESPTWDEFDHMKLADHRFVAVDREDVLGWVAVSPTSTRPCYRGVVEDALYVTDRARGRGVGRALLEHLVASTDAGDVWTVVAGIFPENEGSIVLHESLDFHRVGVRERIGLMTYGPWAGMWRDVVWMERRRPE
jgi:L-amino acid N-acyltransferase YncA